MYTLTNNGRVLYDPRLQNYTLGNPQLTLEGNKLGTLVFSIYTNNPEYSRVTKTESVIGVHLDGNLLMYMRPAYAKAGFRGGIEYRCEELAARMNDIKRRPGYYSGTVVGYIKMMVNEFMQRLTATPASTPTELGNRIPLKKGMKGSDVAEMQKYLIGLGYSCGKWGTDGVFGSYTQSALRQFQKKKGLSATGVLNQASCDALIQAATDAGIIIPPTPPGEVDHPFMVGNILHSPNDQITAVNSDYVGYWDELQTQIVDNLGGYIVPRYQDGFIYIDYLGDDDLPESQQEIRFAENMLEMTLENDTSETFTVLIPLGADVDVTPPPAHEEEPTSLPLTIASVNDGKDYLESEEGIQLYGRREQTHRWEDIEDANALKAAGQKYLDENAIMIKETLSLSAADLHNAGVNVESLRWMTRVRAYSAVHGVDDVYPLTRMEVPMANPTTTSIQLGASKSSLTDRISGGVDVDSKAIITPGEGVEVPAAAMTSYSGSNCTVSASSEYHGGYRTWMAFDFETDTSWACKPYESAPWIQIETEIPLANVSVYVYGRSSPYVHNPTAGRVLASNDGSNWTQIGSFSGWSTKARAALLGIIECEADAAYTHFRLCIDAHGGNEGYAAIGYMYLTGNEVYTEG